VPVGASLQAGTSKPGRHHANHGLVDDTLSHSTSANPQTVALGGCSGKSVGRHTSTPGSRQGALPKLL
jgi:hypothetical protein